MTVRKQQTKRKPVDVHTIFKSDGAGTYVYHHLKNLLVFHNGETLSMTPNELFRKIQFDKRFCQCENIDYLVRQKIPSHIEEDRITTINKGEDNA
tara:strand:+ start:16280 stop:16564 length:285 start_codon:yes stop_codon:yes gene_type:complete